MTPDWLILTIWFVAGISATGSFWYFLAARSLLGAIGSACITFIAVTVAIILQIRNEKLRKRAGGSKERQLLAFVWSYPLLGDNEGSWAVKESAALNGDLGTARENPALGVAIVTTELALAAFGEAAHSRIDLCVSWGIAHAEKQPPYQMLDTKGRDWMHYEKLEPRVDFRHTLAFAVVLARTRRRHDYIVEHLRLALSRQSQSDGSWPSDSVKTISPVFS